MTARSAEPLQCGRCRLFSPADPAHDADPVPKWWLCPTCRVAFFGDDGGRKQSARWD